MNKNITIALLGDSNLAQSSSPVSLQKHIKIKENLVEVFPNNVALHVYGKYGANWGNIKTDSSWKKKTFDGIGIFLGTNYEYKTEISDRIKRHINKSIRQLLTHLTFFLKTPSSPIIVAKPLKNRELTQSSYEIILKIMEATIEDWKSDQKKTKKVTYYVSFTTNLFWNEKDTLKHPSQDKKPADCDVHHLNSSTGSRKLADTFYQAFEAAGVFERADSSKRDKSPSPRGTSSKGKSKSRSRSRSRKKE